MKYTIDKNLIKISGKEDFNPQHILECGQIFAYKHDGNEWQVLSRNERAIIKETASGFDIFTTNARYFEHFFDLKTDYSEIKRKLSQKPILKNAISFGHGIRILKNDLFETLISFIISANNNIKRIQLILNRLRQKLGENMGEYNAFPTRQALLSVNQEFFTEIGCGYRAPYLYKVLRQADEKLLQEWSTLPTSELRAKLIGLSGVGPKVADCILLFGYSRGDVFPVDTWIAQMYNKYYSPLDNREKIRQNLVEEFGALSGYAQQYLFYDTRERG